MKKWLVTTVLLCGASLSAQENTMLLLPYAETIVADTASINPAPNQNSPLLKSEKKAFNLSLWGTLIPLTVGTAIGANTEDNPGLPLFLMSAGYFVGPSLGYFYGERSGRGMLGMGIRLLLAPAPLAAAFGICGWDCGSGDEAAKWAVVAMGGGAFLIAGIDILAVKGAVRKRNRSLQETGWILVPVYFAEHQAGGLKLQVTF
ncbi:MAG: hypothetical protein ACRECJ_09650 [Limisphaerales bacterium]